MGVGVKGDAAASSFTTKARTTRARLRELAKAVEWAGDEVAQAFLREAVAVVER